MPRSREAGTRRLGSSWGSFSWNDWRRADRAGSGHVGLQRLQRPRRLGRRNSAPREKHSASHHSGVAHGRRSLPARECRLLSRLAVRGCGAFPHVASDVVQSFAGSRGAAWLTVAMAISALGALHVVVLTGARIPYAMARDGVFFRFTAAASYFLSHSQRFTDFSRLDRRAARAQRDVRRTLFSVRFRSVDLLRPERRLPLLRLRRKEPNLLRPVSGLGLSLDTADFFDRCGRSDVNLWIVRPVRSSLGLAVILGRHSLLLPLAQSRSRRGSRLRTAVVNLLCFGDHKRRPPNSGTDYRTLGPYVRFPRLNVAAGAADASRAMLLTSCRKVTLLTAIFAFL